MLMAERVSGLFKNFQKFTLVTRPSMEQPTRSPCNQTTLQKPNHNFPDIFSHYCR